MQTIADSAEPKHLSRVANSSVMSSCHERISDCCIVGDGPAGIVLALLLARQGVEVVLLEAHESFDRDFRGDTVHPATLELLEQLGLLDRVFELPHARMADFAFHFPDGSVSPPGRPRPGARHPHALQVPQARFLEMLVAEARRFPAFHLFTGARAEQLLARDGIIHGVRYRARDGSYEVHAKLVVGADGRFSKIRQLAGLQLAGTTESADVLWLRLPHGLTDPGRAAGMYLGQGEALVVVDHREDWQIAYIFPKGTYLGLRSAGLEALRRRIAELAPWLADRTHLLRGWGQTSLLVVQSGRVRRWYRPGLLLIGDAAHVMSPVAGVGINYAIQDAVAASNLLGPRLRRGEVHQRDLAAVQRRREWPTSLMQLFQRHMQPTILVAGLVAPRTPWTTRLLLGLPPIAALRGRLIDFGGLWPERNRLAAGRH
jgi:2-polyprenyl-6-methoxyphenol hydroxylase-like FAD-dependent oxidoreductase